MVLNNILRQDTLNPNFKIIYNDNFCIALLWISECCQLWEEKSETYSYKRSCGRETYHTSNFNRICNVLKLELRKIFWMSPLSTCGWIIMARYLSIQIKKKIISGIHKIISIIIKTFEIKDRLVYKWVWQLSCATTGVGLH